MFELSFEINGKKVNPDNTGDAITDAALQVFRDSITKTVGSIRCPEHGESAKIIGKGRDVDSLSFCVSGCCEELNERVKKELE
jgi:hypothetical protein